MTEPFELEHGDGEVTVPDGTIVGPLSVALGDLADEVHDLLPDELPVGLTADELAEIERRCKNATCGPWERYGYIGTSGLTMIRGTTARDRVGRNIYAKIPANEHDAAFIAHARADVPRLLDEIERLKEETDLLRNMLETERGHREADNREAREMAAKIERLKAATTCPNCGVPKYVRCGHCDSTLNERLPHVEAGIGRRL